MKSNVKGRDVISMDDIWVPLQEKTPDPGRLIRMKISDTQIFIGFADYHKRVYAFSFATGSYFPLDMVIEELQKKKGIEIDKATIKYANLKDTLVNSIPGYLKIISEMEGIIGGQRQVSEQTAH